MGRYTINEIVIKNLKHFKGDFPIELEGKNLLLYGENGSGKSSIYWALHMFYQSCLKAPDSTGAGKYFDPDNAQNLRNAYADRSADAGVVITFQTGGAGGGRIYSDTNRLIDTTATSSNQFMRMSLRSSDFMSYKSLSSLYDFRNSQLCDLTTLFEREIYPTMDFSESLTDLDGIDQHTTNISDWWNAMAYYLDILPRRSADSRVFVVNDPKYAKYVELLRKFNDSMEMFLSDICLRANRVLRDDFKAPYEVELEYERAEFNRIIRRPGARRSHRDNWFDRPVIILKMKWIDAQISTVDHKLKVEHPQSFFNEAKLTIAAFAIRLAIIEMKYAGGADCAPIICIDDLLISLDMGNRIPMAERILQCTNDYQLLIFTHDKALYNLFMDLIPEDERKANWLCKEMYNVLDDLNISTSSNPHLCDSQSYMEKAKVAWYRHDIPAAVNYLRKEAEKQLKRLYPKNMQTPVNQGWMSLGIMLEIMPDFVKLYSLPENPIRHMNYFRSRLLNPLSHDDFAAPVYSNELKTCIEELTELTKYEKKELVTKDDILSTGFEITMTNGTTAMTVKFQCVEIWDCCFRTGIPTSRYYKNVDVKVVRSSNRRVVKIKDSVPLNEVYELIYTHLGYTKRTTPKLEDVVTRLTDGKLLRDI